MECEVELVKPFRDDEAFQKAIKEDKPILPDVTTRPATGARPHSIFLPQGETNSEVLGTI